jgi:hypothetical protein
MNFSDQHSKNSVINTIGTQWSAKYKFQLSAQYELSDQQNVNSEISEIWAWSAQYNLSDQRNMNLVINMNFSGQHNWT